MADVARDTADSDGGASRLAYLAVSLQTIIAAATSLVAKGALRELPPYALTMLRLLVASGLVVVVVLLRLSALRRAGLRAVAAMAGLGLLGVTINQAAFLRGLEESTPARASLLYALSPLMVLLIGRVRGSERLTPAKLAGIVLGFAGVGVILSDRQELAGATRAGDLLVLGAVVAWSVYTALGRPLLAAHGSLVVTAVGMLAGTVAFVPVGAPAVASAPLASVSAAGWGAVLFLGAFSSVAAYVLWYFAVARLPASRVAVFMNLQSPLVVVTAWALYGDPITPAFVIGAVLVLAGVRLAQRGPS